MKKWMAILLAFALFRHARSDVFSRRVENDINRGQITPAQALYLEALRVIDPGRLPPGRPAALPAEGLPAEGLPAKCGFSLTNRIRAQWDRFSADQQSVLSRMVLRPDLPLSLVSPSGRFKIHYTTTGSNSVPLEDLDRSGICDYAEKAAVIMDSVYAEEVGRLNFKAPPKDDTDGPEWDIYIRNIPGSYGWTNQDKLLSANPNVYTSYIEMDNNYTSTPTRGLNGLRTTAAHEFFHMIQLGYNGRDDDRDGNFDDQFIMEASSTWMEDMVFDRINDYYFYLTDYFEGTNIPFDRLDGWREYGLSLWFHFLVKRYGTPEIVRGLWEQIVRYPALKASDQVLTLRGSSFRGELALYHAWNVMTGSRADTVRFYPEGASYPEIRMDENRAFRLDTTLTAQAKTTAARYFRFTRADGSAFTLVPVNAEWELKNSDDQFTLALINDGSNALYTSIGGGAAARILSGGNPNFKCTAVVETPGQKTGMIGFGISEPVVRDGSRYDCYPNPFVLKNHADVTIPFDMEKSGLIHISILDPSGYAVRKDKKYYAAGGLQAYHWNGRNDRNEPVAGGIYVAVVATEVEVIHTAKLAVIR